MGNDDSTQRVLNSDGNRRHEACAQTDEGKCVSDLQPAVMKLDMDANDMDKGGEVDHLEGEGGPERKSQQPEPNAQLTNLGMKEKEKMPNETFFFFNFYL